MDNENSSAELNRRLGETESSPGPRGIAPGKSKARAGEDRQSRQAASGKGQVRVVVRVDRALPQTDESAAASEQSLTLPTAAASTPQAEIKSVVEPSSEAAGQRVRAETEPQQIPARMMK